MNSNSARSPLRVVDESTAIQLLSSLVGQESFGVVLFRAEEPDFRVAYANDAFARLFPEISLVGRSAAEFLPSPPDMGPVLGRVAQTGQPWLGRNHPLTVRSGGRCDVRYYTYRLQRIMLDGRAYVIGTALDVTAEMRALRDAAGAHEDLDRSEDTIREHERIGSVLQAANDILEATSRVDDEWALARQCLMRALQVTDSSVGFLGRVDEAGDLRQLVSEGLPGPARSGDGSEISRWMDEGGLRAHIARVLASREAVMLHSDDVQGARAALRNVLLVPIRHDEQIVAILGVADPSKRYDEHAVHSLGMLAPAIVSALRTRRTLDDLHASKQLLEEHMSNAPLAVIEFDTQFRVTRWSEEAERMFGYAPDEVLGKRIVDMHWVYEEDVPIVEAESRRMFAEGVTRSKNVNRNYRRDGSVIWCEWYSSAIHDQNGLLISVLSRVLDVTARLDAEEQLRQRAQQVSALKSVAETASSALELQTLAERLVHTLASAAEADAVMLFLAGEAGELRPLAAHGMSEATVTEVTPAPPDAAASDAFAHGRTFLIDDLARHADDPRARRAVNAGMRSAAALPMLIEDKPIGVISLGWREPSAFSESKTTFLQSLARETAVGIQNAMLFESERSRRRRIQSLHGVLEVAVSSLDAAEAAQRILGYLMDHHTFDLANCWLARGDALELLASINYPAEYAERYSPMPLSARYDAPHVHRTGRSVVVTDSLRANTDVREMYAEMGVQLGAYVIVPLRSRGHTVGTLNLGWREPRTISPGDLSYFESLGSELGVVLENAELMRERTAQAAYAEALNRINEAVHSTLEFDEIMQRVVVESAEVAGFHRAAILLQTDSGWRTGYSHNPSPGAEKLSSAELELLLGVDRSSPVISVEASNAPEPVSGLLAELGMASYIAVPLVSKGQIAGYLAAWSTRQGVVPEDRQVDFMRKVGATVSLALENVRLYEAERSIADRLQGALLTLPEHVPGMRFAHAYRSATEAARVGGDFYDLFELGANRVGVVIGDVAGKGIDAAVLTSLVKNTVQAHASEPGKTPGQVLELTNDVVFKSTSMEAFVTVFFGVLDCRDGTLAYANGGHTTGALVRPGGPTALGVTGPLLGAFGNARFRDTWARLDLGDVLFLYTDGLTEARGEAEMFGEQRLFELLGGLVDASPEQMLSEVLGHISTFTSGHLGDDMAILAVQLTGCDTQGPQQQRFAV